MKSGDHKLTREKTGMSECITWIRTRMIHNSEMSYRKDRKDQAEVDDEEGGLHDHS
jgi:hypothetical protein